MPKEKKEVKNNNNQNGKSLESWLWDAACSIRGAKEAAKYKDFILPLVFTKRLCDVFDDEVNRIAKEVGGRAKAFKLVKRDKKLVRFYIPLEPATPEEPVWSVVRKLADKIGVEMRVISIRDMKNKWASFALKSRLLIFNAELLKMDKKLGDYVIVHELLHFAVPNHGRLWKSLMRAHLGDYEVLGKKLNRRPKVSRK